MSVSALRFLPQVFERKPERVLEEAVMGMLPKTLLRRKWAKKLRIFPDEDQSHLANTAHSAKVAGSYLDTFAPPKYGLRKEEETGDFVVDYDDSVKEEELK